MNKMIKTIWNKPLYTLYSAYIVALQRKPQFFSDYLKKLYIIILSHVKKLKTQ